MNFLQSRWLLLTQYADDHLAFRPQEESEMGPGLLFVVAELGHITTDGKLYLASSL